MHQLAGQIPYESRVTNQIEFCPLRLLIELFRYNGLRSSRYPTDTTYPKVLVCISWVPDRVSKRSLLNFVQAGEAL